MRNTDIVVKSSNITPDVGYRNSLTRARQEPPSWEDAAPAQGGYPIPPQDGAVGQPSGSSKEPLGFINSKQRLAPPLKDKASKLSATAFPSYSTAERQSNQLQSMYTERSYRAMHTVQSNRTIHTVRSNRATGLMNLYHGIIKRTWNPETKPT